MRKPGGFPRLLVQELAEASLGRRGHRPEMHVGDDEKRFAFGGRTHSELRNASTASR